MGRGEAVQRDEGPRAVSDEVSLDGEVTGPKGSFSNWV